MEYMILGACGSIGLLITITVYIYRVENVIKEIMEEK